MSYLDEIAAELQRIGDRPVTGEELLRALRAMMELADQVRQWRERIVETVQLVGQLEERLLVVDELPESAPFAALIRLHTGTVQEQMPLYLGNGPTRPLTKLVPTAL